MLAVAVILIIIWSFFYVRNGYEETRGLKKSFDKDPDSVIKNYQTKIKVYEASIQDLKRQLHNAKALPTSWSHKHQVRKLEKQINKAEKEINNIKAEKDQYIVLLTEYRDNKMQDPKAKEELMKWIKTH